MIFFPKQARSNQMFQVKPSLAGRSEEGSWGAGNILVIKGNIVIGVHHCHTLLFCKYTVFDDFQ
jgi:hypothetical protein